jgi:methionine--tRNA ligase beta chain
MISFDDFKKVELKVGTVKEAERVEGSEKLLKLQVDLGAETRQILAGVGKVYAPEQMVGRQIIVVTNLEPRQMMGLESQGMLLAASSDSGPILLTSEKEAPAGATVG